MSATDIVTERAKASLGTSSQAIYIAVVEALKRESNGRHSRLADVGCGTGTFRSFCLPLCDHYCGIDVVCYEAFPPDADFKAADLDAPSWPVGDGTFDATVSIETIEHLENPRAFFREIARITRPGGVIIVTTPNQLSLLSKLTLIIKNEFTAFQERPGLYPAHRTALLAVDLIRIARESGLENPRIQYSNHGRIPGTSLAWPKLLRGCGFSDNLLLIARKPPQNPEMLPSNREET
jgi:2-polyprenyl-3-methyl-5-hydroxy-6-metoxy-1,4-benzoquinol methylase